MPLPRALARFNRVVTNRVLGRLVGLVPAFAEVRHVGRRTGRHYATPVGAFRTPDGFAVALTYGSGADWVRNVLADGGATLRHVRGTTVVTAPRVLEGADALALVPAVVRPFLRLIRADEVLQLTARRGQRA